MMMIIRMMMIYSYDDDLLARPGQFEIEKQSFFKTNSPSSSDRKLC